MPAQEMRITPKRCGSNQLTAFNSAALTIIVVLLFTCIDFQGSDKLKVKPMSSDQGIGNKSHLEIKI